MILIITIILFILGLLGTLLPFLPGPLLIWLGVFIFAWADGFVTVDITHLVGQGILVGIVFAVDWVSSFIGVKRAGGSRAALIGAAAGLPVGLIILGPLGIIIGPLAGAFLIEFISRGDLEKAFRVSIGSLIGFLGGTFFKVVVGVVMIVWFFLVI